MSFDLPFRTLPVFQATIPFASCEILSNRRHFTKGDPRPLLTHKDRVSLSKHITTYDDVTPLCHGAPHDAEALKWLLTWICLTRSGPGGNRRPELRRDINNPTSSSDDYNLKLHDLVWSLFLDDNYRQMGGYKADILNKTQGFPYPPDYFGDYFKPLKGLWEKWREIILVAHRHPIFEKVHDFIIDAIDETIKELFPTNVARQRTPEEQKVLDDREEKLRYLKDFTPEEGKRPATPSGGGTSVPSMDFSPANEKKTTSAGEPTNSEPGPSSKRPKTRSQSGAASKAKAEAAVQKATGSGSKGKKPNATKPTKGKSKKKAG